MTESGVEAEFVLLSMDVVGYEVEYRRSRPDEPPPDFASRARLNLSVKGATVEHHENAPVNRVVVNLSEVPGTAKLGRLIRQPGEDAVIRISLPMADFAPIWAALRLDRVARLDCRIIRPPAPAGLTGDDVVSFEVRSRGSLFQLFGA
jgi:hypothetical protein